MTKSKTVSFRIKPELHERLKKIYLSANVAADWIFNALLPLRDQTLEEIKGKFLNNEFFYLIDMMHSQDFDPATIWQKELEIIRIKDAAKYNNLDKTHAVDLAQLIEKIKSLTVAQIYFLFEFCKIYWETTYKTEVSLNNYIKQLL